MPVLVDANSRHGSLTTGGLGGGMAGHHWLQLARLAGEQVRFGEREEG